MTIFGIGGCMALLLVGYGLKDSILDVAVIQYDEIQTYDAMVVLDEDATDTEKEELLEYLNQADEVEDCDAWYMKNLNAKNGEESRDLYLVVPEQLEKFPEFVNLRDRKTKEGYTLTDEGVVLAEKTATLLDVKAGDTISLEMEEGVWKEVTVSAVCENYMYHYAYMTPSLYEELMGELPEATTVIYESGELTEKEEEAFGQTVLEQDGALGISYMSGIKDQLNDMLGSLNIVMIVLIVSAGLLAFVVLYNLNNININERKRELATLKVLGFYDGEVGAYVYRENVILTIVGAALGCVLGALLHRYIIVTVEVDVCMFGRNINFASFVYAILFTVGFSVLVNFVMYFKLKKIDMVESLKSVE
jgi:putative ABC transport system permease protein